jgi:hypothetical protein
VEKRRNQESAANTWTKDSVKLFSFGDGMWVIFYSTTYKLDIFFYFLLLRWCVVERDNKHSHKSTSLFTRNLTRNVAFPMCILF